MGSTYGEFTYRESSAQITPSVSSLDGGSIGLPDCPRLSSISTDSQLNSDDALFGSGDDRSTQTDCTCSVTVRKRGHGKTIYVTVADDSEQHVNEVLDLCKSLVDEGFKIHFDYKPSLSRNGPMNINDWRDKHFTQANFVLVCISPRYAEYCSPLLNDDFNEDIPNENRLAVRYIFNHIRSEIKDGYCQNKRFITVVFTNSGGLYHHIPRCLRIAWPFYFPYHEDILNIKDHILS